MSKVTAIVNQKGGVGKTTTALNLGYALSEKGIKVLLIDFDPQSSLTSALGYDAENKENIQTLMTLAIEEEEIIGKENYILNVKENLDLIPCSLELSGIEMGLVNVMSRELILKSIIEEIKKDHDYILIDCSPSLGMLTINALAACNTVLIPVTPEYLSAKGLALLINNIKRIKKRLNPSIEIDGILITMIDERTNLSKNMLKALKQSIDLIKDKFSLEIKIFESRIPRSVRTGEAILNKKSIIEYELFIIFAGVSEYLRLKLIASGVKEAIQSAIISLSIENYDNVYSSSREGYSGEFKYIDDKDSWEEMIDIGDLYGDLDVLLGLRIEDLYHVKIIGGEYEYKLSNLEVNIINTPFAPNSEGDVFEADSYISLEVPLSFGWDHLPPLNIRLKVKSEYMAKF